MNDPLEATQDAATSTAILVDAHVHFYDCFDRQVFLDCAVANLSRSAASLELQQPWSGVLLMAESSRCHLFDSLAQSAGTDTGEAWRFSSTSETDSLVAERAGAPKLFIVAGRQIATADGLEVLALATHEAFPDGEKLSETVSRVRDSSALVCLPWGFGKWTFQRKALVADLARHEDPRTLFLGDNGCRPAGWPEPRLFSLAREAEMPILAGSDPLPFPSHEKRVGSYGVWLSSEFDEQQPTAALKRALESDRRKPLVFGKRSSWLSFLVDQLRLRTGSTKSRPEALLKSVPATHGDVSSKAEVHE